MVGIQNPMSKFKVVCKVSICCAVSAPQHFSVAERNLAIKVYYAFLCVLENLEYVFACFNFVIVSLVECRPAERDRDAIAREHYIIDSSRLQ